MLVGGFIRDPEKAIKLLDDMKNHGIVYLSELYGMKFYLNKANWRKTI